MIIVYFVRPDKKFANKKIIFGHFHIFWNMKGQLPYSSQQNSSSRSGITHRKSKKIIFHDHKYFWHFLAKNKKKCCVTGSFIIAYFYWIKKGKKNLCPPKIKIWKKLIFTFLRRKWIFDQGCRTPILFGNIHFGICEANPVI